MAEWQGTGLLTRRGRATACTGSIPVLSAKVWLDGRVELDDSAVRDNPASPAGEDSWAPFLRQGVAQLGERQIWDLEAGGSRPLTLTSFGGRKSNPLSVTASGIANRE